MLPAVRLTLIAAVLALPGCARDEREALPSACTGGAAGFRDALQAAPGQVRVGGVPISGCFVREAAAGDVVLVGQAVLDAAAPLADRARTRPGSPEAAQLGYLVGAVRRGAADTQGIHDELVRRLDQELGGVETEAAAFRRGLAAGRRSG